ncbi:MAG: glycosyltransferase [Candidatus Omnitrophica bacterium]|nr:glycosyltransferase [Candidatus Omnitrophota bacterium]
MSDALHILHIDTDLTWRGGQQQAASLIKQLHRMKQKNVIVSPPDSEFLNRIPKEHSICRPVRMRGDWDVFSAYSIARIIRQEAIDVIHAHSARAHTLAVLAKRIFRIPAPVVVSRRVDFPIRSSIFSKWKYQNADFYIPISKNVAELLAQAGVPPNKMEIVYSSVDGDRFAHANGRAVRKEFSIDENSIVIGNIGVCEERKCQQVILEAASLALQKAPNVHFFIVGDGSLRQKLMQLSRQLNIQDHVHFPGFRTDVGDFLDAFDIFVFVPNLEGLGSSILDAQFFSLPVIATPIGGIPEIVLDHETGMLIPVNAPEHLAQRILDLIDSPPLRKRLGGAGRRRVQECFLSTSMAEKTLKIYQKTLNEFTKFQ